MTTRYGRATATLLALAAGCLLACSALGAAEPATSANALRLAPLFGEHVVLQSDAPVPVWGWGKAGDKLTVEFIPATGSGQKAQSKTGKVGADGRWSVVLKPLAASGQPARLTVASAGGAAPLEIKDVLVGDVWVCAGQSNMDFGLGGAENGAQEVAAADFPRIRFFTVPHVLADAPATDVKGQWTVCSPKTAGSAYAAAYFFARELQQKLDVPIGLVQAAWSGMPAEAATPREALETDPALRPILQRFYPDKAAFDAAKKLYDAKVPVWQEARRPSDTGNAGEKQGWADPATDLAPWGTANLPMMFMHGDPGLYVQGAFWFRREVEFPEAWAGHPVNVELGPISDFDTTYLNGRRIGATAADSPDTAKIARTYAVPGELVRAGKNVVAVRMFTRYGEPGFGTKPDAMRLVRADAADAAPIPLAGPWRYRAERVCDFVPLPRAPVAPDGCWSPTRVYNGMIAPLIPFRIRGVLWYQGEHNGDAAEQYRKLFPALVAGWRKNWGQGDFPFIFAQLPNWLYRQDIPSGCPWAELRDVQRQCLSVPKTGMAVTIDLGDAKDIHPKKKQEVGRRLALAAEKVAYGLDVPYSGPLYRSLEVVGNRAGLRFDCTFGGLKSSDGGALQGFTVAGEDRRFVPAQVEIAGDMVWVSSAAVPKPVAVRYAWAYNPACNLVNGAGLPASPFRTDDWPFLLPLAQTEPDLR